MEFTVEERRGRPEVVSLSFATRAKGRGVRTADLARLNVDALIRTAYQAAGGPRTGTAAYRAATRPGRVRTVDGDLLERAAQIYEDNREWAPRKAVAEALDVSLRSASYYIAEARREGLLQ